MFKMRHLNTHSTIYFVPFFYHTPSPHAFLRHITLRYARKETNKFYEKYKLMKRFKCASMGSRHCDDMILTTSRFGWNTRGTNVCLVWCRFESGMPKAWR